MYPAPGPAAQYYITLALSRRRYFEASTFCLSAITTLEPLAT